MRRAIASALLGGFFLAVQFVGTSFASARIKDQAVSEEYMKTQFGDWVAFTASAPPPYRCIINNGPFRFQIFPDGHRELGGYLSQEEMLRAQQGRPNDPGILTVREIVGSTDRLQIRLRRLVKPRPASDFGREDVVIPDDRMTIEVRSSREKKWGAPEAMIEFLKREQSVRTLPRPGFIERRIKTDGLSKTLNWCNHILSK